MSHWTVYTLVFAILTLGVVYSSIQSGTEGPLEDLNLAESMLIQNLTRSEDKGRISLFASD
jgi:hypothetical protein